MSSKKGFSEEVKRALREDCEKQMRVAIGNQCSEEVFQGAVYVAYGMCLAREAIIEAAETRIKELVKRLDWVQHE